MVAWGLSFIVALPNHNGSFEKPVASLCWPRREAEQMRKFDKRHSKVIFFMLKNMFFAIFQQVFNFFGKLLGYVKVMT